ncbi:MAG TPA: alpha/beta hydrolase [Candidatus Angelobacter sp.]|nr:alpha/beta hydrolase [Candidatus Angelobacter sp.]
MDRRRFLSAISLGSGALFTVPEIARAAEPRIAGSGKDFAQSKPPRTNFFPGFQTRDVKTSSATIHLVVGGSGPPVLLLHGYPQTHIVWRKMAPQLARDFTVVAPDLRGYGDSSRPPDGENHSGYSKRAMARDQVEVMEQLGFRRFAVIGHDRGGRVAHRMALDYRESVERLALLDIVPTYKLFTSVTREFATSYFHWFFLIQDAPLPESLIGNSLEQWLAWALDGTPPPWMEDAAYREYLHALRKPGTLHALCEDYRAAAGIDLDHDAADLHRKIECPLLALWGAKGAMQSLYDVLQTWKERATDVRGKALDSGHFLPEQASGAVLTELRAFLQDGQAG